MNLNKKGITLVEIVISVALISLVLVFLFTLLIQINNENSDNEIRASYLTIQSSFIKQIEEDFFDYKVYETVKCRNGSDINVNMIQKTNFQESNATNIYLTNWDGDLTTTKCLNFKYKNSPYYGHLFLYQTNEVDNKKTILAYYRGNFKQSVELEDFDVEKNKEYNETLGYGLYEDLSISLPIVGPSPNYNDYSINLSIDMAKYLWPNYP